MIVYWIGIHVGMNVWLMSDGQRTFKYGNEFWPLDKTIVVIVSGSDERTETLLKPAK